MSRDNNNADVYISLNMASHLLTNLLFFCYFFVSFRLESIYVKRSFDLCNIEPGENRGECIGDKKHCCFHWEHNYSQDPWFQRYHRFEAFEIRVINKVINPVTRAILCVIKTSTLSILLLKNNWDQIKVTFIYGDFCTLFRRQKLVPTIKPIPQ